MQHINERGIQYLKNWIIETTKTDEIGPYHHVDARNLDAWASEAEQSLANGNPAMVEMNHIATQSGRTETFIVPDDGITTWEDE